MAAGKWNTAAQIEQIKQAGHMRGSFIPIFTGPPTDPAYVVGSADALYVQSDPTSGVIPLQYAAPHFTLPARAPGTGRPTMGFEFVLMPWLMGTDTDYPLAIPGGDGFTVTVWKLLENLQVALGPVSNVPPYAGFRTLTGVAFNRLYRTFDVDACTIRFQVANIDTQGYMLIYVTPLG